MNSRIVMLAGAMVLMSALLVRADPPRVVSASPDNGQTDVNPATKQLRIVFDQPMDPGGWSIVGGGPNFPKLIGKPRWVDDRTLVVDVQLKADQDYALSINNPTFTNFRNVQGEPAVPYPIAFTTAATGAGAAAASEANRESVRQLREAIDREYSYRDLRGVDWDKLFSEYTPKLERAATPRAFARLTASMLSAAKDMHIVVRADDATFPTHRPNAGVNFNPQTLARTVTNLAGDGPVATGRFEDGITYVLISTWAPRDPKVLESAYDAIANADAAKGLIIDVRPNSGGDELLARAFAGCFVDAPKVYSTNTIRRDGQWHGPFDRVVEPNAQRRAYRGPVVVLMGPQNMSSCESFLLMMRQVPDCKLVGARSYGSSGNPRPHELANGVTVLLPSWKDMLPDGTPLEGVGVAPDIEVATDAAALRRGDPVLDAALKITRSERK